MTFIILWLFSGIFAWNITLHSFKRYYYLTNGKDYWKTREGKNALKGLRLMIILYVFGGFLSLCTIVGVLLLARIRPVYYYEIKD